MLKRKDASIDCRINGVLFFQVQTFPDLIGQSGGCDKKRTYLYLNQQTEEGKGDMRHERGNLRSRNVLFIRPLRTGH